MLSILVCFLCPDSYPLALWPSLFLILLIAPSPFLSLHSPLPPFYHLSFLCTPSLQLLKCPNSCLPCFLHFIIPLLPFFFFTHSVQQDNVCVGGDASPGGGSHEGMIVGEGGRLKKAQEAIFALPRPPSETETERLLGSVWGSSSYLTPSDPIVLECAPSHTYSRLSLCVCGFCVAPAILAECIEMKTCLHLCACLHFCVYPYTFCVCEREPMYT